MSPAVVGASSDNDLSLPATTRPAWRAASIAPRGQQLVVEREQPLDVLVHRMHRIDPGVQPLL